MVGRDELDSGRLIHGLRCREADCYEEIFRRYWASLVVFVTHQVGDREMAKDLVSDIFFKMFENSHSLPDTLDVKAYLFRAARNAAVDYLRHLQVVDKHNFLLADAMLAAREVEEVVDEDMCTRVNAAVEALPEQCRLIIKMSVMEGKKYTEIADELGISINTIRTQVARGYRKLRDMLSSERDSAILFFILRRMVREI